MSPQTCWSSISRLVSDLATYYTSIFTSDLSIAFMKEPELSQYKGRGGVSAGLVVVLVIVVLIVAAIAAFYIWTRMKNKGKKNGAKRLARFVKSRNLVVQFSTHWISPPPIRLDRIDSTHLSKHVSTIRFPVLEINDKHVFLHSSIFHFKTFESCINITGSCLTHDLGQKNTDFSEHPLML